MREHSRDVANILIVDDDAANLKLLEDNAPALRVLGVFVSKGQAGAGSGGTETA